MTQAAPQLSHGMLRAIRPEDNAQVAHIIRAVLTEHGCTGPGYAIHDPEVDAMYETYQQPRSQYFVVEELGVVAGGGGVAPLKNGDGMTCELQKFYVLPQYRGRGYGRLLLDASLAAARQEGFALCYLETLPFMEAARAMYEQAGFSEIDGPMGNTGHYSCDKWYVKELTGGAA
ncbi:MAG: GNAT family N-acetyltransferase [Alphaproteobacteria bacterium]